MVNWNFKTPSAQSWKWLQEHYISLFNAPVSTGIWFYIHCVSVMFMINMVIYVYLWVVVSAPLCGGRAGLTAGWSRPSVFSRIAKASCNKLPASLYFPWSLKTSHIQHSKSITLQNVTYTVFWIFIVHDNLTYRELHCMSPIFTHTLTWQNFYLLV